MFARSLIHLRKSTFLLQSKPISSVRLRSSFNLSNAHSNCITSKSAAHRIMWPKTLRSFATLTEDNVPVVAYEVVKDLSNHPEKLLIDVREPKELQETGIIPHSINIPLADVKTALELSDQQFLTKYNRKKPTTDDEIIFSCRLGMRTLKAAVTASSLGYKNVKHYKGSWTDWAEREGLPQ